MKILFCADIYETKYVGPARFAEMLLHINEIYKGIHEVRVLTADVAEEQMPVYKMSLRYPKFLRFLDPLSRGWKYYRGIRRIENEYEFDVVLFGNAIGGIVPKFLYRGDIKVVGMINDYISVRVNITNFYKLRGGKGLLLQKQFEKLSTFYLNTIIVCSEYLKELLSQAYYCPKKKIKRLHQGIDIGKTSFKPKAIEGKNIEIIFLKYLFDYGGLSDLAVTLGQLRKYDFNLSVVGPAQKYKGQIEKLFARYSNVQMTFFGPVTQEVVHQMLSSHDILCIPSHLEALGLANAEGLAHGINVVSTWEGGIPEVLDNGQNGWLSQPGDPESLANAIRDCIEASPEERLEKQTNGRKFVEKYFDFKVSIDKLLAILESHQESEQ